MARNLKNKGPCDPRLNCSTKLENFFSFSLRNFFLLVHKVSSSIFPYMHLNSAFTSFFFMAKLGKEISDTGLLYLLERFQA